MQDRIEKEIELKAPVSRVWRALTDHEEFGEWFRVDLDGPFKLGEVSTGKVTYSGCEGKLWHATVVAMEPEELFAYAWVPGEHDTEAEDPPRTRVEFHLRPTDGGGTHLRVVESGFSALPEAYRETAFRENERGWAGQLSNIQAHVDG